MRPFHPPPKTDATRVPTGSLYYDDNSNNNIYEQHRPRICPVIRRRYKPRRIANLRPGQRVRSRKYNMRTHSTTGHRGFAPKGARIYVYSILLL